MTKYLNHWGLEKPAFAPASEPSQTYIPQRWKRDLDIVNILCHQSGTLNLIISENGHGKSSLARYINNNLSVNTHDTIVVALFYQESKSGWLIPKLAKYLGYQGKVDSLKTSLEYVAQALDNIATENRLLSIIIDEADKLSNHQALEEIHSLISIQSIAPACINFTMIGTQKIQSLIEDSPKFTGRIRHCTKIPPLDLLETREYIRSRLKSAGLSHEIVPEASIRYLHSISKGIFAHINTHMENALIRAWMNETHIIDAHFFDSGPANPKNELISKDQIKPLANNEHSEMKYQKEKSREMQYPPREIPKASKPKTTIHDVSDINNSNDITDITDINHIKDINEKQPSHETESPAKAQSHEKKDSVIRKNKRKKLVDEDKTSLSSEDIELSSLFGNDNEDSSGF